MSERVVQCPHCGAPVTPPSKWARSVVCAHCGVTVMIDADAIPSVRFREAREAWESKDAPSIAGGHYRIAGKIASGARSDVFLAERARFPTERVVVKLLRDVADRSALDREWTVLEAIAKGSSFQLGDRVPIPVARGVVAGGAFEGRHATIFRWAPGFVRSVEEARRALPDGIAPEIATWIWRRLLEVLAAVHRLGFAHGDVSAAHLVFQEEEHGVRVVGWSSATPADDDSRAKDVIASAVAIRSLAAARLPSELDALLYEIADGRPNDAWTAHEALGEIARRAFGPPRFHPLRF